MNRTLARTFWYVAFTLTALLTLTIMTGSAAAQADTLWRTPINLSQSGAATQPAVAVGPNGAVHMFWQDQFAGVVYTTLTDGVWQSPQVVDVPFVDGAFTRPTSSAFTRFYDPLLLADSNGRLQSFWIDVDGALVYSRVLIDQITEGQGVWTAAARLSTAAAQPQVSEDANGRLHLAYIRPSSANDLAAGVYYRQSDDGGNIWTEPQLVYESAYLRAAPADSLNLRMALSGDVVHLAWSNPLLETIYYAASADGGATWDPTAVTPIDFRTAQDAAVGTGPQQVRIAQAGGDLHAVWQAANDQGECVVYHSRLLANGRSWDQKAIVFDPEGLDCLPLTELLVTDNGMLTLFTRDSLGINLLVWNGARWSLPQMQQSVLSLVNPTTFRDVELACDTPFISGSQLMLAGCGMGAAGDVWFLERPLGTLEEWAALFVADTGWQAARSIVESDGLVLTMKAAAAADGRIHLAWLERSLPAEGQLPTESLFYAFWDGENWSRRAKIRDIAQADQLAINVNANGQLFAVWRGDEGKSLFLSRVLLEDAMFPGEWSIEREVVSTESGVASPVLHVGEDGTLYLFYALPINENRGIYLVKSTDAGATWTAPVRIFDAAADGWVMVDDPKVAQTAEGALHVLFTRYSEPNGSPIELHYARSLDAGATWEAAQLVHAGSPIWSDLAVVQGSTLLRVLRDTSDGTPQVVFQRSQDAGSTWEQPAALLGYDDYSGEFHLVGNGRGFTHMMQISQAAGQNRVATMSEWVWRGQSWLLEGTTPVLTDATIDQLNWIGVLGQNGDFVLVYPDNLAAETGVTSRATRLMFLHRQVTLDGSTTAVVVTPVAASPAASTPAGAGETSAASPDVAATAVAPTPAAQPETAVTTTPEVVATAVTFENVEPGNPNTNLWLVIALIPTILIVLGVIIFIIRRAGII